MDASCILDAIGAKYPRAVIVPEISINDPYWHDWDDRTSPEKRHDGHKPYRRIDALMFESFQRSAIEVKISAADYRLDTEQKRRPWRRVTHTGLFTSRPPRKPLDLSMGKRVPDTVVVTPGDRVSWRLDL